MESNGFALELAVGIKDLFTQTAKKVDAEVNKLDKDAKAMQKTFDDISAYKKTTKALEDLLQSGNATKDEIKQQEKALDELSKTLKKTGVDINNITKEEERLTRQVKDTNAELKKRVNLKSMVIDGVTSIASYSMLKSFMAAGDDSAKLSIMMRNQSKYTMEEIKSESERIYRLKTKAAYNVDSGEIMGYQTAYSRQNNLKGKDNQAATTASLHLQSLTGYDPEEITRAMSPLLKEGVKPDEAMSLIYDTFKKTGDIAHDLPDTIHEYFQNLASRGLSAKQFFAALQAGAKAGVYNYDKVGDSLKETFGARLTDPAMLDQILGHGKTAGAIESITDPKLKSQFAATVYAFKNNLENKRDTTKNVADLYKLLGRVGEKSPGALFTLSTTIGGTMLTTDSGVNAAPSIGEALSDPSKALGNITNGFDIKPEDLLTAGEQRDAAKKVAMDGMINASEDLTQHLGFLSKAAQDLGVMFSSVADNHPVASEVVAGTITTALAGLAAYKGGKAGLGVYRSLSKVMGWGKNIAPMLEDGVTIAEGAAPVAEDIATTATKATKALKGGVGSKTLKFLSGGKGNALLTVGIGGINAYSDYKDGNMKGVTGDVGGISGAIAGTEAGAVAGGALGTLLFPGVGTGIGGAIGGIAGGFLGEAAMKSLSESAYDWFNGDDRGKDSKGLTPDQQINKRIDDSAATADATTNVSGNGTPTIELNFNPQINIEALSASPDDISKAVEDALRQSNPELIQMLQYALEQVMANNDHQQASH